MIEKKQAKQVLLKNRPKTDFILGIDPGLHGGWAVFDVNRQKFKCVNSIPLIMSSTGRHTYDVELLYDAVEEVVERQGHNCTFTFCIERQQAMPKQGVVAMFTTGFGYGVWHGIISSFHAPFPKTHQLFVVRAGIWQQLLIGEDAKDDTKAKSIARVQRLFPEVDLILPRHKTPSDGLADACNIAHYAYLRMEDTE